MNRATLPAPLRALARLYGVQTDYQDVWGQPRQSGETSVFRVLQLLGAPLDHPDDVPAALRDRRQQLWQRVWEPVHVAWQGGPPSFRLRLPRERQGEEFVCRIQFQDGGSIRRQGRFDELSGRPGATVEGVSYAVFELTFPQRLPWGYHQATLEFGGQVWQSLVISAPRQAYGPPPEEQPLRWGVFLPLYALHGRQSYQTGDFSDLERLMEWTAGAGGSLVATLPLLATLWEATDDPSPYSAASRLFWNEVYLDPTRLPEFSACPAAQAALAATDGPAAGGAGSPGLVDYDLRMQRQRAVLEPLADQFFAGPAERQAALHERCRHDPELEIFARFRATGEQQRAFWPDWPARLQRGEFQTGDYDPRVYRYHLYTQWQIERQLRQVTERAGQLNLLWYLDFPLGVTRNGYDAWREREIFQQEASGGAPPDAFFTKGQNWGFPPLHPERLRQQGYRHLIAALHRHLEFARVLRFDHVMALHRLYWIPSGMTAREGVYVRFPAEELFALLTLESHRHQAQIVGENLGTVPQAVNRALAEHNLRDMYVLQYEMNPERPEMLRPVPTYSVASLNTHDMPHFAAYWYAQDVDDRVDLGLLPAEQAEAARQERAAACGKLVQVLQQRGLLKPGETDLEAVLEACLKLLAASPSPMVLVNLEDLWLETRPQNVPGTFRERPNWRRRARYGLEEFPQLPAVQRILAAVDQSRRQAPGPTPAPPEPDALKTPSPSNGRTC